MRKVNIFGERAHPNTATHARDRQGASCAPSLATRAHHRARATRGFQGTHCAFRATLRNCRDDPPASHPPPYPFVHLFPFVCSLAFSHALPAPLRATYAIRATVNSLLSLPLATLYFSRHAQLLDLHHSLLHLHAGTTHTATL